MHRQHIKPFVIFVLLAGAMSLASFQPAAAGVSSETTPVVPTVTGTPSGVIVTVSSEYDQINVRSGPNTTYEAIGVLLAGQQVPAKGRSPKGEWVLVDYPGVPGSQGWVYSYNLVIPPGSNLPIVEPPPEPTPEHSPTVDPTLAAQFIVTIAPTRLPTFTPPPPLAVPTLPASNAGAQKGIPAGMVIVGLGSLGILLGLVSLFRDR